ncbi:MAG TPA: Holliday junction resolvase RuvX [Phycicoccus sp.]|jgi:putative Holliday junction resolvase|nr:Holliday junction resolvase RuvX [Phycicoccus sp.]HQK32821.1 Holliday junction resolvase RuvX [Phycicoccus sp.]HQV92310.1 Holliday junction resolvase RuvX [Phycicoccus sp.]HQY96616.1 Holliday junction resolvase RuvX [Phycicoccus sp.]HRA44336.1 Holliday junction resolvase RuvX [Phycicoccus sp.]
MRRGVRLGIDVGSVRVGVARSDPDGILATPVRTVARSVAGDPASADPDIVEVLALVRDEEALEVVVGLPRTLAGDEGAAAMAARKYAHVLAQGLAPVSVRLLDERFTTVDAHRALRESGVAGSRARRVVDQMAAVLILQSALDQERGSGRPPGAPVGGKRRKPRGKDTRH